MRNINLTVSAKDIFHKSVKKALQKEQWRITSDPLKFKFREVNFQIDLGIEKIIAAEKGNEKIAIEIKSFLNPSAITDFYSALGQFRLWCSVMRSLLEQRTPLYSQRILEAIPSVLKTQVSH
jgi:hypothetical protein